MAALYSSYFHPFILLKQHRISLIDDLGLTFFIAFLILLNLLLQLFYFLGYFNALLSYFDIMIHPVLLHQLLEFGIQLFDCLFISFRCIPNHFRLIITILRSLLIIALEPFLPHLELLFLIDITHILNPFRLHLIFQSIDNTEPTIGIDPASPKAAFIHDAAIIVEDRTAGIAVLTCVAYLCGQSRTPLWGGLVVGVEFGGCVVKGSVRLLDGDWDVGWSFALVLGWDRCLEVFSEIVYFFLRLRLHLDCIIDSITCRTRLLAVPSVIEIEYTALLLNLSLFLFEHLIVHCHHVLQVITSLHVSVLLFGQLFYLDLLRAEKVSLLPVLGLHLFYYGKQILIVFFQIIILGLKDLFDILESSFDFLFNCVMRLLLQESTWFWLIVNDFFVRLFIVRGIFVLFFVVGLLDHLAVFNLFFSLGLRVLVIVLLHSCGQSSMPVRTKLRGRHGPQLASFIAMSLILNVVDIARHNIPGPILLFD